MLNARRDLRGIIPSLNTPFTQDDQLEHEGLRRMVDYCAAAGCPGILISAVAGEVAALRPDERRAMMDTVAEASAGRLNVIAGISAETVEESVELAAEAAGFKVAMVLWQPPPGLGPEELIDALERISSSGGFQIMLQDLDWSGPGIAPETIMHLADRIPALTAVKIETVPAGPKYSAVAELAQGRLHLSGGWAVMQMMEGLMRGLDAFVPSGLIPLLVKVFDHFSKGEREKARALFETALPILCFSNQHIHVSNRFWKIVRHRQGLYGTDQCRIPPPLDPIQLQIADALANRAISLESV